MLRSSYSKRCSEIKEILHSEGTFSQAHLQYAIDSNDLKARTKLRMQKACEEQQPPPSFARRCFTVLCEESTHETLIRELVDDIKKLETSSSGDAEDAEDGRLSEAQRTHSIRQLEERKESLERELSELLREMGKVRECSTAATGKIRASCRLCCQVLAGSRACDMQLQGSNARPVMLEEIDERTQCPKKYFHSDDGYSRLDCNSYLAVRHEVHRARMKQEVQPVGRGLRNLKIYMAVATTVSVVLGAFDLDLWIAVSTAMVSFSSSWLEYLLHSISLFTLPLSYIHSINETCFTAQVQHVQPAGAHVEHLHQDAGANMARVARPHISRETTAS